MQDDQLDAGIQLAEGIWRDASAQSGVNPADVPAAGAAAPPVVAAALVDRLTQPTVRALGEPLVVVPPSSDAAEQDAPSRAPQPASDQPARAVDMPSHIALAPPAVLPEPAEPDRPLPTRPPAAEPPAAADRRPAQPPIAKPPTAAPTPAIHPAIAASDRIVSIEAAAGDELETGAVTAGPTAAVEPPQQPNRLRATDPLDPGTPGDPGERKVEDAAPAGSAPAIKPAAKRARPAARKAAARKAAARARAAAACATAASAQRALEPAPLLRNALFIPALLFAAIRAAAGRRRWAPRDPMGQLY